MGKLAKKKRIPRKAMKAKPLQPAKDQERESEDIERAVYDGMQDLRVKKSG
jgi:hypothetical protein